MKNQTLMEGILMETAQSEVIKTIITMPNL